MSDKVLNDEEIEVAEGEQELYEHHRIVIEPGQFLIRIDKYLINRLQNATRTKIQTAIDAGTILVNDKTVKSNYKVKPHDVIVVFLAHPPRALEVIAEDIPINIIYEDSDIVVVNKEAGLVVHPAYGNYSGTLVNALAWHFKDLPKSTTKIGDNLMLERPGLVHRIDKNTSGILIVAKTEIAMTRLAKDFFDRNLDRRYQAMVWGDFKEDEGTITVNVGRSLKNRQVMAPFPQGDFGKHAVTHYKVLERFGYVTLIECKLETGRTHQIRVHLQYIGHPVFNDATYGGEKILRGTTFTKYKQFVENCFKICPRHALHAKTLTITHPITKKQLAFNSDLADDMQQLVDKWRKYSTVKRIEEED